MKSWDDALERTNRLVISKLSKDKSHKMPCAETPMTIATTEYKL